LTFETAIERRLYRSRKSKPGLTGIVQNKMLRGFMRNRVTEMLGVDVPIFGFTHKPEVAIEVTNAGGMGALAASYYQPDELERILTDMDDKTGGKPYCIDVLFANKVGDVVPTSERLLGVMLLKIGMS
jgi:NAD(P)H-dependent flavin oxidoreductase YrpB (nitropropane dioxygenase family)